MRKHNSKLELIIKHENYLELKIIIITRNIIIKKNLEMNQEYFLDLENQ